MSHRASAPLATSAVLLSALLLTGCGAADTAPAADPAASAPAVEPAAGDTISGTGYTYAVPEDWGDPGPVPGFDPDSFAADLDDADGFSDNVNVILSPAGKVELDQIESAGPDELEGGGASDVTVEPRVQVAGAEAAHLSASLAAEGTEYVIEQYYLSDDDQTYVVTFSFSPDVAGEDRSAVTDAVLASWTWTS